MAGVSMGLVRSRCQPIDLFEEVADFIPADH
jgi:hypothetical protein